MSQNRSNDIRTLEASLIHLVEILRLDPSTQWCRFFETHLNTTKTLLAGKYSQSDLNDLSASIMRVYAGMGSFNDYVPGRLDVESGRFVVFPGAERFAEISSDVHTRALALRIIGDVL